MQEMRERLERLEQRQRSMERQLGLWRSASAVFAILALLIAPVKASMAEAGGQGKGVPAQIDALQAQVAALQAKLVKVSVQTIDGYYSLVIDGANVHIRNGLGTTDTTNGLGNLVIGYNESRTLFPDFGTDDRTGSHNLVVGAGENYSSYGGIVVGLTNAITAPYASVSGGAGNISENVGTSVSGGQFNAASGLGASVSGGRGVVASFPQAWAAGGFFAPYSGLGTFHSP